MKYQYVCERSSKQIYRIKQPRDAVNALKRYRKMKQEHFLVLTLDGEHKVIRVTVATVGILNRTLVHPREIFRRAIEDNANAIILSHNHPSGNTEPSEEDNEVTSRLSEAGKLLGISVLDHIIISPSGFYSYLESGNSSLLSI